MSNLTSRLLTLLALLIFSTGAANAQFEYISPKNGSINNFRDAHMILRNGALMNASSVSADKIILSGSESGIIAANVVLSTDGKTVCITPSLPFKYGETVDVTVLDGLKTLSGESLTGTTFSFSIRKQMTATQQQQLEEYLATHDDGGYLLSEPRESIYVPHNNATTRDNTFDFINILTNNSAALAPGELFFHRNSGASPTSSSGIGYGIMTSDADSVFYRASTSDGSNFHVNLNGDLTALRLDANVDTGIIVMDSSYNITDVVHCKNGLAPSQHEQLFFPDGSKWFCIYDWQAGWDLSQYPGGSSSCTVNVSWIQAVDGNGNVTFEWRTDEHFLPSDATPDISLGTTTVDPWHINAFFKDNDGNLIVSLRNMDRIVKVKVSNGSILWQWKGLKSTDIDNNVIITSNDPNGGFSHAHNVQRIANGHILMFDNGNSQPSPNQRSQPKEYILDETNLTANCVWYYTHPQVNGFNMYTRNQGSVQRFANGNTLIGYGLPDKQGLPNGGEIDANGNILWEFRFKDSTEYTYRLYKTAWDPNVGIADVKADRNQLQVYPNPGNGLIAVTANIPAAGKVTISVVNLLGQKVFTTTEKLHAGLNTLSLDLTALHEGIYVLDMVAGKMKLEQRLVIE
ncbi:MAG: aryl-sulfate sulfotransferase [Chitinophagales bacterium]|nr:aryl-sulfate sulfotransferase [Chitinophagales bacterium]